MARIFVNLLLDLGEDMGKLLFRKGTTDSTSIALTFDDGPDPVYTPKILDILDKASIQATFFILGEKISENLNLLHRIHTSGHEIGNHGFSHETLAWEKKSRFIRSIEKTDEILQQNGLPVTRFFRPPYGRFNPLQLLLLSKMNKQMALWNVGPKDFQCSRAEEIQKRVMGRIKPGSVVVLHDGNGDRQLTVDALPRLIELIKNEGFEFKTLSELID